MTVFAVRYTHPDAPGWAEHLEAHTRWLLTQLQSGALLASGPITLEQPTEDKARGALLLFQAASREELETLIESDPYSQQGLVSSLSVEEWNPLFGVFQGHSSLPAMLQQAPLGQLLNGLDRDKGL